MYEYKGRARTNDEDFVETFELITDADVSAWSFEFVISDRGGVRATATSSLNAELKQVTFTVPRTTMEGLSPQAYNVGGRYTVDGVTSQLLVGTLPVKEGNFTP